MQTTDTRITTNFLKGFAITGVIVGHYYNTVFSGNPLAGFAHMLIVSFYFVSGYGIYYSLQKRFTHGYELKSIARYYYDRFSRLLPTLYLAAIAGMILFKFPWPPLYFWTGIVTPGAWFIASIIQCYLLSIPLFKLLKNLGTLKYFVVLTLAYLVFLTIANSLIGDTRIYKEESLNYAQLFLANIYVFGMGLMIPLLNVKKIIKSPLTLTIIAYVIAIMLNRKRFPGVWEYFVRFVYFYVAFYFSVQIIFSDLRNRIVLIFAKIGEYSLSIYLFHVYIFLFLLEKNLLRLDSRLNHILLPLVFAFVLAIAVWVEASVGYFVKIIEKYLNQLYLNYKSKSD